MGNRKKQLENSTKVLKESLEGQIEKLKDNFDHIGKNALWIGGSLVGVYTIIKLLNKSNKKKHKKKAEQPDAVNVEKSNIHPIKDDTLLSSTIKEQLIIFFLGIATQKLSKFLTELEEKETSNDPE